MASLEIDIGNVAEGSSATVSHCQAYFILFDTCDLAIRTRASFSLISFTARSDKCDSFQVLWRGKPVFIRRRTGKEIASAEADNTAVIRASFPSCSRRFPCFPDNA